MVCEALEGRQISVAPPGLFGFATVPPHGLRRGLNSVATPWRRGSGFFYEEFEGGEMGGFVGEAFGVPLDGDEQGEGGVF